MTAALVLGCVGLTLLVRTWVHPSPAPPSSRVAVTPPVRPLAFERNVGQTDAAADFVARTRDGNVFLTRQGPWVVIPSGPEGERRAAVRLRMQGTSGSPSGEQPLPGKASYFVGSDSANWRVGIPTYGRAVYPGSGRGVDVAYYGTEGHLEFDLVLAPRADVSALGFTVEGADALTVAETGDLQVTVDGANLTLHRPGVFQGEGDARVSIAARYVLEPHGVVRIVVAPFDASRPLLVDPVLTYSTYVGGTNGNYATAVAVDTSGNAYVVGFTSSATFPISAGIFQRSNAGGNDVFVSKLNPTATAFAYSTYLGGSSDDYGYGIAVDSAGNVTVVGETSSADFPVTAGSVQSTHGGGADAFITRLNATGGGIIYSSYLGGVQDDSARGVALGTTGVAYVVGTTASPNFPATSGSAQTTLGGNSDAFVAEVAANGSSLVYATFLGGAGNDFGNGIAIDATGRAYATGQTLSANFPTTTGALQTTRTAGVYAAFVSQVAANGATLGYSTYYGGSKDTYGAALAIDTTGNAYIAGSTDAIDLPGTTGGAQPANAGETDGFVAKLNAAGSALSYATYIGSNGEDGAAAITVDGTGNARVTGHTNSSAFLVTTGGVVDTGGGTDIFVVELNATGASFTYSGHFGGRGEDFALGAASDATGDLYVVGSTTSNNYPTTAGTLQTINVSGTDGFVTKINPAGTQLSYSTLLGGVNAHQGQAVAVDSTGNVYVAGSTDSPTFPTTAGVIQPFTGGLNDAFVMKMAPGGASLLYSTYLGGTGNDYARALAVDGTGDVYVTGYTYSTDFAVTAGVFQPTLDGGSDAFLTKLDPQAASLLYSTYLGGGLTDSASSVAIDSSGNAYVSGTTNSLNFPTTTGAFQVALGGNNDAFVSELNPTATALIYSTYVGGTGSDVAYAMAIDGTGAAFLAGTTSSTDFPITSGVVQATYAGANDAFVTKVAPGGGSLAYSTFLGGSGNDIAFGIAVDSSGNATAAGATGSTNFPVTSGAAQGANDGGDDAFIARLDPTGATLKYSTYLGGNFDDFIFAVTLDDAGNAYVTGETDSTNFPVTPDATQPALSASFDVFVTEVSAQGTQFKYSTYLGGTLFDNGNAVALDSAGNLYVAGTTGSPDFPMAGNSLVSTNPGGNDVFLAEFSPGEPPDGGMGADGGRDGGSLTDAGGSSDAGGSTSTGGCGCGSSSAGMALWLLPLLAVPAIRRRRSART